jgi:transglutaminase-like putative cysteine protease
VSDARPQTTPGAADRTTGSAGAAVASASPGAGRALSLPPLVVGAATLFWGWQSGNLPIAAPLALLLEAPRWLRMRFALDPADYARISDLCTVFFVGLAVVIGANRGVSQGVIGAFQWLPLVLAPILLAQRFGAADRVPLTALFRYMRKQKERNPALPVPMVDTAGVYVALCVISAGVGNAQPAGYYAGAVLLAAWALYALRPPHARLLAWGPLFAAAVALGFAGHLGLAGLQQWVGGMIADWHMRRLEQDPSRSITDIGAVGRLKQRDVILARIYGSPRDIERARLLHRASYNAYVETIWVGRRTTRGDLQAEEGGATWTLAQAPGDGRLTIAMRTERRRTVLALPPGATRLTGLAATEATRNGLGVVQATVDGDWIQYGAEFGDAILNYDPPAIDDDALPVQERATFARIAAELGLRELPPAQAMQRVLQHFAGFRYSLWRDAPPPKGTTALADFMTRTQSGHCEYFAAAATLLLRAAGVPARYATGYAIVEYSELEEAHVVRARHAHAWTRVWLNGRWVDLDPTPPDWLGVETDRLAPAWERIADYLRWASYRWEQREELQAGDALWGVLAVLVVILAWRLLRGKRLVRGGTGASAVAARVFPGADSEFYELVKALPPRDVGETLSAWLQRVAPGRYEEALRLHQRYRFDPKGLGPAERQRLRELSRAATAPAG